jgi:hypothetical protein
MPESIPLNDDLGERRRPNWWGADERADIEMRVVFVDHLVLVPLLERALPSRRCGSAEPFRKLAHLPIRAHHLMPAARVICPPCRRPVKLHMVVLDANLSSSKQKKNAVSDSSTRDTTLAMIVGSEFAHDSNR